MSTHADTPPSPSKALTIGLIGIVATAIGLIVSPDKHGVATGWLVGLVFWMAVALGMLLLVMIHHVFDASWSVILRRQFEHALTALPWLFVLFLPLIVSVFTHRGFVWYWMDTGTEMHGGHGTIAEDPLFLKKSGFLSVPFFVGFTALSFGIWIFLANKFRGNSFSQDSDGSVSWTRSSRKWSAIGLPLTAITLTGCVILWVKSLDYHWFSTMYGVWFFANAARAALGIGVIILLWLHARGNFKGILNTNHLHSIGQLVFAFTVFWAYITFSQYFLIWGANIPEETFWYNLREINTNGTFNQWGYVGMLLLFGHFLFPFLFLLSYKNKVTPSKLRFIVCCILTTIFIDMCYNIMPSALKDHATGNALPFLSVNLVWAVTSVVGVGGICTWAYLKSFPKSKLIPIRDPRIEECLTHHE